MKTELGASKMVQWVRTLATKPEFAKNRFGEKKKNISRQSSDMHVHITACNPLTNCIRVKKEIELGMVR